MVGHVLANYQVGVRIVLLVLVMVVHFGSTWEQFAKSFLGNQNMLCDPTAISSINSDIAPLVNRTPALPLSASDGAEHLGSVWNFLFNAADFASNNSGSHAVHLLREWSWSGPIGDSQSPSGRLYFSTSSGVGI